MQTEEVDTCQRLSHSKQSDSKKQAGVGERPQCQKHWKKNAHLCQLRAGCPGASLSYARIGLIRTICTSAGTQQPPRGAAIITLLPRPDPSPYPTRLLPKNNVEVTIGNRNRQLPALRCITCARVHSTPWAPLGHRLLSRQVNRNTPPPP